MKNDNIKKPELLAPAGDLEKLRVAIAYGADAIYMGGQNLGLRAKAKNFDLEQMEEGVTYAHNNHVRVYVTANIFAHNEDFEGMADYFKSLEKIGVDALIISDLGIFSVAREVVPNMEIHISTQANNTNYKSIVFWQKLGAKRVVMARELSLGEITEIRKNILADFQLEAFVHGAMCMSYSGRCLLSNYMNSRDSNRGNCSQPCRFNYTLMEATRPNEYFPVYEDDRGTYIFNSKDLCMVEYLPELIKSGIDSFKIEGRMKTPYYVGSVVKAYREAIDDFYTDEQLYESKKRYYAEELTKTSHRAFTTGFNFNKPDQSGQVYDNNSYIRTYDFVGIVIEYDEDTGMATIEQRNKFVLGDTIEFLRPKSGFMQEITEMYTIDGEAITEAPHPQQLIKLKVGERVEKFDMMRKEI